MQRSYQQIDVFSSTTLSGNPLAVVLDGEGLSTEEMQRFANWMNLSETTFILPPTSPAADYRVRIFTPSMELPFAGHPTVGTCHAWMRAGGTPRTAGRVVQECGVGLVPLRVTDTGFAFVAPPMRRSGPAEPEVAREVAAILGVSEGAVEAVEWVDNGPGWVVAMLHDVDTLLGLQADLARGSLRDVGAVARYPEGSECAFEVRAFFEVGGKTAEDPVTGSLNASLAQWLLGSGRASSPYVASQGTALGRRGRVHVEQAEGEVWIGGRATTVVEGTVEL